MASKKQDLDWMRQTLRLAAKAKHRTWPNPMVGCILVKNQKAVGSGWHKKAGGAHAEVLALRKARGEAEGATAYVNLEPCAHYGKTGPCAHALVAAGVRRVVIGISDTNPNVRFKGIRILRRAGIQVSVGVAEDECRALNRHFLFAMKHGRPLIAAKIAQSLDGCVATHSGVSQWITSVQSRRMGRTLRAQHHAIMVGGGTLRADNPRLTTRIRGLRDPIRIVLSQTIPSAQYRLFEDGDDGPVWLLQSARKKQNKTPTHVEVIGIEALASKKTKGSKAVHLNLQEVLSELHRREIRSILLEGGPTLIGSFFDQQLVDELHVFTAPMLIGGVQATRSVLGLGASTPDDAVRLKRLEHRQLAEDSYDLFSCSY